MRRHAGADKQSTILYRITMGTVVASPATVGSNHEIHEYKGVRFGMTDLGGQTSLRSNWPQYFQGTTAVILVIDSSDPARLGMARTELNKLVSHPMSHAAFCHHLSVYRLLGAVEFLPIVAGRLPTAMS